MYFTDAIKNLEKMSTALSSIACNEKHYNTEYGQLLEHISWDLSKHASDLKSIEQNCSNELPSCQCANGCFKCLGMSWKDFI